MAKILVNGVNLHVEVQSDGPPVLLLHGFPDSLRMWDRVTPHLINAGYKTIAFDQRGFGESDAPVAVSEYRVEKMVEDARSVISEFCADQKVRLVGHDWGAVIGWLLAIQNPEVLHSYVAVSVGHPNSYRTAGFEQKRKAWYMIAFQFPYIAECMIKANNFAWFRALSTDQEETERWISDLSRPGRLTAALNWYRANLSSMMLARFADCSVPVLGIYSPGDIALTEEQMVGSKKYVTNTWRYERIEDCGHWIPTQKPDALGSLLIDWFKSQAN